MAVYLVTFHVASVGGGPLGCIDKVLAADSHGLGPIRFADRIASCKSILDARAVERREFKHRRESGQEKQSILVHNAVSFPLAGQFVIAAPAPFGRMLDRPGADHVQIHVTQTAKQVHPVLNACAVIGMLPDRSLVSLAQVPLLRNRAGRQFHHVCDRQAVAHLADDVGMVARNHVAENRHMIAVDADAQPLPVGIPLLGKAEKELSIRAKVVMVNFATCMIEPRRAVGCRGR